MSLRALLVFTLILLEALGGIPLLAAGEAYTFKTIRFVLGEEGLIHGEPLLEVNIQGGESLVLPLNTDKIGVVVELNVKPIHDRVEPKPRIHVFYPSRELAKTLEGYSVRPLEGFSPILASTDKLSRIYVPKVIVINGRAYSVVSAKLIVYAKNPDSEVHGGKGLVIIVPEELADSDVLAELVSIHEELGFKVRIATVEMIKAEYAPVEKPPIQLPNKTIPGYDFDLARRIIAFLRDIMQSDYKYVLIIGGASSIPPSAYYSSLLLETLLGPWYHVIPTDYFYADPDYDFTPELAVGRIPFSDVESLAKYVEALKKWIKIVNSVEPSLLYVGGAPFAWTAFFGEAVATELTLANITSWLSTATYLTRSLGNLHSEELIRNLRRGFTIFFPVMHGDGRRLVDFAPQGLLGSYFETILDVDDLENLSVQNPFIVLSPACVNAAWDIDLIKPDFKPPSLGIALLSKGLAVAYLGPSRVDFELIRGVSIDSSTGVVRVDFAGATLLYTLVLAAMKQAKTLGDAWIAALKTFYASKDTHYEVSTGKGWEDIALINLLQATLLGDPTLPLPRGKSSSKQPRISLKGFNYSIPAEVVFPMEASGAVGALPIAKPGEAEIVVKEKATVGIARIRFIYGEVLIGMESLRRLSSVDRVRLGVEEHGLLSIGVEAKPYYIHILVAQAGIVSRGNSIEVLGLSLLRMLGDEPAVLLVDGKLYTIIPAGIDYYEVKIEGKWSTISVKPLVYYQSILAPLEEGKQAIKVLGEVFTTIKKQQQYRVGYSLEAKAPSTTYTSEPKPVAFIVALVASAALLAARRLKLLG